MSHDNSLDGVNYPHKIEQLLTCLEVHSLLLRKGTEFDFAQYVKLLMGGCLLGWMIGNHLKIL